MDVEVTSLGLDRPAACRGRSSPVESVVCLHSIVERCIRPQLIIQKDLLGSDRQYCVEDVVPDF
jgi:hypothetical protein